jgi:hypothetical protein
VGKLISANLFLQTYFFACILNSRLNRTLIIYFLQINKINEWLIWHVYSYHLIMFINVDKIELHWWQVCTQCIYVQFWIITWKTRSLKSFFPSSKRLDLFKIISISVQIKKKMDNSLIHIPVTAFLKALCKVGLQIRYDFNWIEKNKEKKTKLVFTQIVFLIKFGWGLYYTIQGICDKVQEKQGEIINDSHPGSWK